MRGERGVAQRAVLERQRWFESIPESYSGERCWLRSETLNLACRRFDSFLLSFCDLLKPLRCNAPAR